MFPLESIITASCVGYVPRGNNQEIAADLDAIVNETEAETEELGPVLEGWKSSSGLEDYLQRCLFVEVDQVVVPSLNLKSAKQVVCQNERQKRRLRKMGFIEDRIIIRNIKDWRW